MKRAITAIFVERKAVLDLLTARRLIVDVVYQVRNERDEWIHKALKETCTAEERQLIERALAPLTRLIDYE